MTMRRLLIAAMAIVIGTSFALGALSPEMRDWAKGPAQYLMTKEEAKQWKSIKTDDQAQSFIDLFWARRDLTPGTPQNEFKMRFEALVKYADEHFAGPRVAGSMTDRGKVFILFGSPTKALNVQTTSPVGGGSDPDTGIGADADTGGRNQKWIYEGEQLPKFVKVDSMEVTFEQQRGDYRLARVQRFNIHEAMEQAVENAIVSPNLTEAPSYAPRPAVAAAQVPAAATLPTEFKTDAIRSAVEEFKSAKTNPWKEVPITCGGYVTADGDYFAAVNLFVPGTAGMSAGEDLTFFGQVADSEGKVVAAYEKPVKLMESKGDFFVDQSLDLDPGKYTGVFGLAKDGKPVAISRREMDLQPIPEEPSASQLILSNNIYPLTEPQKPEDPYAFGGIKVVPKGDQTFTTADELWYFVELRKLGLDANGSPKMQAKLTVEGKVNGKNVKMEAPLQEVAAEGLKGVPAHYALGSSIPLSGFKPGDYTLKVQLIDGIDKRTWDLQEGFKVVAAK